MVILCSETGCLRAGWTPQQGHLNRHLLSVRRTNTWTFITEAPGENTCPWNPQVSSDEDPKSHTLLSINCAQITIGDITGK